MVKNIRFSEVFERSKCLHIRLAKQISPLGSIGWKVGFWTDRNWFLRDLG